MTTETKVIEFAELARVNLKRAAQWHDGGIDDWSISDWAVAMAGEAGEACNAVKKLRRVQDSIANLSDDPARHLDTIEAAMAKIGEELADTVIYADLLAQRLGLSLEREIIKKFNATSDKYGFSEKLGGE